MLMWDARKMSANMRASTLLAAAFLAVLFIIESDVQIL